MHRIFHQFRFNRSFATSTACAATTLLFACSTATNSSSATEDNNMANSATTNSSNNNDDDLLFQGQCLKRQMHVPKVPYPAWDYDWDSNEVLPKGNTTRHIILVRHGQYDETHKEDALRGLTELGKRQADQTGERLAEIAKGHVFEAFDEFDGPCSIKSIRVSDMKRAKETAQLIAKHLPGVDVEEPDPMLNEGLPAPIIPLRSDATLREDEIDEHRERIEGAFQKYFYRAKSDDTEEPSDEFEIIVCHGNVIRYFFCRALQLPPEAWLRMSIFNCSMTYLIIRPNGHVSARMLGDIGHLKYKESTFSGNFGFKW